MTKKPPVSYWHEANPEPFFAAHDADRWLLYKVKGGHERIREQAAKRYGLRAVVPMAEREKKRRRGGKRVSNKYPVLGGYVFVGFPEDFIPALAGNVVGMPVISGDEVVSITPTEMANILQRAKQLIHSGQSRPSLEVGDRLIITSGSMRNKIGSVKAFSIKHSQVEMLLRMLGVDRPVKISMSDVRAV